MTVKVQVEIKVESRLRLELHAFLEVVAAKLLLVAARVEVGHIEGALME